MIAIILSLVLRKSVLYVQLFYATRHIYEFTVHISTIGPRCLSINSILSASHANSIINVGKDYMSSSTKAHGGLGAWLIGVHLQWVRIFKSI